MQRARCVSRGHRLRGDRYAGGMQITFEIASVRLGVRSASALGPLDRLPSSNIPLVTSARNSIWRIFPVSGIE